MVGGICLPDFRTIAIKTRYWWRDGHTDQQDRKDLYRTGNRPTEINMIF